jgi:CheY-like chemotaxis protein
MTEPEGHALGVVRNKRYVLVVDSNQRDASYASMLLQNFGYNATTVRAAEEALEFMAILAPALVVSELILPAMNGLDLFDRMKREPQLSSVPLIVQTRITHREIEDHCRRNGCAGCLNKPVQHADLYRAVQQALEPTPRQNIRVPVTLTATIDEVSTGNEFITSLSDSGLFVRTLEPHPAGTEHTITFVLDERVIRVDAVVLYVYRIDENPLEEPGMGMKFTNLSPLDKDVVQSYIKEVIIPGIRPSE